MQLCSLYIPKELHEKFKRVCDKNSLRMNKLVANLIIKWLEDQAKEVE